MGIFGLGLPSWMRRWNTSYTLIAFISEDESESGETARREDRKRDKDVHKAASEEMEEVK